MATPTVHNGSVGKSSWTGAVTANAPRDVVVDDLIILYGYMGDTDGTASAFPAGFTTLFKDAMGTARNLTIAWKQAVAGDAGAGKSWTFSSNAGSASMATYCKLVSGVDWAAQDAPFAGTIPAMRKVTVAEATPSNSQITTDRDQALIIQDLMADDSASISAFPEAANNITDTQSNNITFGSCTAAMDTAGTKTLGLEWTLSVASAFFESIISVAGTLGPAPDTLTDITLSATHDTVSSTCKSTVSYKPLAFGLRTDRAWADGDETAIFSPAAGDIIYTTELTSAPDNSVTVSAGIAPSTPHYAGWLRDDVSPPPAENEDYYNLPFDAETSPWRLTVDEMEAAWCSSVTLSAVPSPAITYFGHNCWQWTIPIYKGTSADPLVTWRVYKAGSHDFTQQIRIPTNAHQSDPLYPETSDEHLTIYDEESDVLYEMFDARVETDISQYYPGSRRSYISDLRGRGITYPGGSYISGRAYGGSGLGGLIRLWELADISVPLRHPLAIALGSEYMLQGPIFPAPYEDANSQEYYGQNPMGTMFRLDPTLDIDATVSNPMARWLAHAMQDYGMYLVDRSGGPRLYYEWVRAPYPYQSEIDAAKVDLDGSGIYSSLKVVNRTYNGGTPPWTV